MPSGTALIAFNDKAVRPRRGLSALRASTSSTTTGEPVGGAHRLCARSTGCSSSCCTCPRACAAQGIGTRADGTRRSFRPRAQAASASGSIPSASRPRPFYEKLGFTVFGTHRRPSASAVSRFFLQKRLDDARCNQHEIRTMSQKLLLLPGDGIGTEIMAEVEKLIAWLNSRAADRFHHRYAASSAAAPTTRMARRSPKRTCRRRWPPMR